MEPGTFQHETDIQLEIAATPVKFACITRNLKASGREQGADPLLWVYAGSFIAHDIDPLGASHTPLAEALNGDAEMPLADNESSAPLS